ncbi:hypothetical protein BsIDN1_35040 [Bacillus safensis]|uniref:Nitrite/Sulfite reductase ferredoxin-like domain-containing protein n=1 Tax=Bacillus safensis TaxID=561879 RepID=A0A5S9MEA2_BACIA|nr:hypothetical protein BsIDN1_35040 [Bacillus safensis]
MIECLKERSFYLHGEDSINSAGWTSERRRGNQKKKVIIYGVHKKEVMLDPISAGIPDDDNRLMKHHGSYLQDDRDLRNERQKQKLEPAYQFMLRVRLPGGIATSKQWLVMDELAHKYGNGTLKLTTRETFQLHGILKWNMKKDHSRHSFYYA